MKKMPQVALLDTGAPIIRETVYKDMENLRQDANFKEWQLCALYHSSLKAVFEEDKKLAMFVDAQEWKWLHEEENVTIGLDMLEARDHAKKPDGVVGLPEAFDYHPLDREKVFDLGLDPEVYQHPPEGCPTS